jgi:hypothetical protein
LKSKEKIPGGPWGATGCGALSKEGALCPPLTLSLADCAALSHM